MAQLQSASLISQHTSSFFAGIPASFKVTSQTKNAECVPRKMLTITGKAFQDNSIPKKPSQVKPPAASVATAPATEVDALQKLETGFKKFKEYYKKEQALFKELAEGQSPPFMIIACADSRVDPCKILDLGLGEAFVVRNVANMVPAYNADACSSAASAIEYAVLHLKVKHLMVCGHSRCGGIKALMGMKEDGSNRFSEFIEDWVLVGKNASGKVKSLRSDVAFDEQCAHCEKEAVNSSLWNLLSFPFVRDKVESGELALHGAYYDFVNATFERWQLGTAQVIESVKYE